MTGVCDIQSKKKIKSLTAEKRHKKRYLEVEKKNTQPQRKLNIIYG